uniref:transposase n=1 Tax=Aquimarina agarivorans TaxID=980584 RepID=UPI000248E8CF
YRIAISDGRITGLDKENRQVSFMVKNYRKGGELATISLPVNTFVNRFQLHILPKGFTRIRHYGLLSSTTKRKYLKKLQATLAKSPLNVKAQKIKDNYRICPKCKKGTLQIIAYFGVRGPPKRWLEKLKAT